MQKLCESKGDRARNRELRETHAVAKVKFSEQAQPGKKNGDETKGDKSENPSSVVPETESMTQEKSDGILIVSVSMIT